MHLAASSLALLSVSVFVGYAKIMGEDKRLGCPVLKHLDIDLRTVLENNRSSLDGTGCADIGMLATKTKSVGRCLISRHQVIKGITTISSENTHQPTSLLYPYQPRTSYWLTDIEADPFLNPSVINPVDDFQAADIQSSILEMLNAALFERFPEHRFVNHQSLVGDYKNSFRSDFLAVPAGDVPLLKS